MQNTTALVSLFARDYHFSHNTEWIFKDDKACALLSEDERNAIADNMSRGISFFAPEFKGSSEDALGYIVDTHLSPSVLVRSAFCEAALDNAVKIGCRQYVIFASGYDSFSLRNPYSNLHVFELDRPAMTADKIRRIKTVNGSVNTAFVGCSLSEHSWTNSLIHAGFKSDKPAFGSLLGISFYLSKQEFEKLLDGISGLWCSGSSICFDFPLNTDDVYNIKTRALAAGAGEEMKSLYTYREMEAILSKHGFLIYEHLDDVGAEKRFCEKYNNSGVRSITPPDGVNYILAVKK